MCEGLPSLIDKGLGQRSIPARSPCHRHRSLMIKVVHRIKGEEQGACAIAAEAAATDMDCDGDDPEAATAALLDGLLIEVEKAGNGKAGKHARVDETADSSAHDRKSAGLNLRTQDCVPFTAF